MNRKAITIQRLLAPLAIIIATAWVTIERNLDTALFYLFFIAIFYFVLLIVEFTLKAE